LDNERLFCERELSGEEAIQAALEGMKLFLIKAIYPVGRINPVWLAR